VTVAGSDCPSGKWQFATRDAAAARAARLRDGRSVNAHAYRCEWCACYHIGNRRAQASKNRRRR
jgi:hypothetical protein